jgi:hypothetical protein
VIAPDGKGGSHKDLHDCGIVYVKDHPYILWVVTEGKLHHDLERVLSMFRNRSTESNGSSDLSAKDPSRGLFVTARSTKR